MVEKSKFVPKKERSKRDAILTEGNKVNIKSGNISPKSKSKLFKTLDKRFDALLLDLDLIADSPMLETWRDMKKYQFNSLFEKLSKKFEDLAGGSYKRIYLDRVCCTKNKHGKKTYWLEQVPRDNIINHLTKKKKPYYSDRIFDQKNVLRGLHETIDTKKKLLEAYSRVLLPLSSKNGNTKKEIEDLLQLTPKNHPKRKMRCKKCGYVYSAKCPDCLKRSSKEFQRQTKNITLNEYVITRTIYDKDWK